MTTEKFSRQESQKRFTLSGESFAQERLRAAKDIVEELKKENPEILSLCVFGSMVKGTARQESDIDGYLFVDADMATEKHAKEKWRHGTITEDEVSQESGIQTYFVEDIKSDYVTKLHKNFESRLHFSAEQTAGVKIRPVNEKILDAHVQSMLDGFQKDEEYGKQYDEWERAGINIDSKDLEALIEYQKNKPHRPGPVVASSTLSGMFHLDVGGGIRRYRGMLISKLERLGNVGERAWEEIIQGTEMFEQDMQTGTKRYPRSLAEARELYGSKSSKVEEN